MILQRREKQTLLSKLRNFIWPKMGLKRTLIYYKHRVLRLPHSTRDIAMGLASGCVVSWTPTFPFQILQCFVFCKIVRANFPAALLGTVFGNPWTFPVLFMIAYYVGDFFLGITGLEGAVLFLVGQADLFKQDGVIVEKFIPTLVGGYIMAALTFPLFYYGFYYLVKAGRASRQAVSHKVHDIIEHHHEKKEYKAKK